MKTKAIISLLMGCLFIVGTPLFAQRAKHKNHKVHHAHHSNKKKAVRVYKYPRNKVVVVRARRVKTVTVLPVGYATVVFKKRNYFHHHGFFYNLVGSNYVMIAPPIGLRVKLLPPGHKKIIIAGTPHFYYMGVYYKQVDNDYETVEPAVGIIVPELPENNVEEITIDGQAYYQMENVLYTPLHTEAGKQYEVVGKLDA